MILDQRRRVEDQIAVHRIEQLPEDGAEGLLHRGFGGEFDQTPAREHPWRGRGEAGFEPARGLPRGEEGSEPAVDLLRQCRGIGDHRQMSPQKLQVALVGRGLAGHGREYSCLGRGRRIEL